jgi:hypothetical protein
MTRSIERSLLGPCPLPNNSYSLVILTRHRALLAKALQKVGKERAAARLEVEKHVEKIKALRTRLEEGAKAAK